MEWQLYFQIMGFIIIVALMIDTVVSDIIKEKQGRK